MVVTRVVDVVEKPGVLHAKKVIQESFANVQAHHPEIRALIRGGAGYRLEYPYNLVL